MLKLASILYAKATGKKVNISLNRIEKVYAFAGTILLIHKLLPIGTNKDLSRYSITQLNQNLPKIIPSHDFAKDLQIRLKEDLLPLSDQEINRRLFDASIAKNRSIIPKNEREKFCDPNIPLEEHLTHQASPKDNERYWKLYVGADGKKYIVLSWEIKKGPSWEEDLGWAHRKLVSSLILDHPTFVPVRHLVIKGDQGLLITNHVVGERITSSPDIAPKELPQLVEELLEAYGFALSRQVDPSLPWIGSFIRTPDNHLKITNFEAIPFTEKSCSYLFNEFQKCIDFFRPRLPNQFPYQVTSKVNTDTLPYFLSWFNTCREDLINALREAM